MIKVNTLLVIFLISKFIISDYHKLIDGVIIKVRLNLIIINFIIYLGNNIPGPDAYKFKTLMGTIYNSKFRSGNLISMSPKFKYKDSRERYPGPGAYIRFSEFGILVSKNARKFKEEMKNEGKNKIAKTEFNETSGPVETTKQETKVIETE